MAIVTRYEIRDEIGRVLTVCGFFAFDDDDAVQFMQEADAIELSDLHPGTVVERVQRWAAFPDLNISTAIEERRSAAA